MAWKGKVVSPRSWHRRCSGAAVPVAALLQRLIPPGTVPCTDKFLQHCVGVRNCKWRGGRGRGRNFTQKDLRDFTCARAVCLGHHFLKKVRILGPWNMLVPLCQHFLTVQGRLWLNHYVFLHSGLGRWPNQLTEAWRTCQVWKLCVLRHGHFSLNFPFQLSAPCRWEASATIAYLVQWCPLYKACP